MLQLLHTDMKNHYVSNNQTPSTWRSSCALPTGKSEDHSSSQPLSARFQRVQPIVKPQGTNMGLETEGGEGLLLSSD